MRFLLALAVFLVGALADRKLKTAKCERDGIYIFDEFSLIMCSNGIGYHQPCPPGTKNSGLSYGFGYTHTHTVFCDVNLNDFAHNRPQPPQHHPVVTSHEVFVHSHSQHHQPANNHGQSHHAVQPAHHHQEHRYQAHHQPVGTHTQSHHVVQPDVHHQDHHHQDNHHQDVHHHQEVHHHPMVHYHDPATHHQPEANQHTPGEHQSTYHEYSAVGSTSSSTGGLIPVPANLRTHSTDPIYYQSSESRHTSYAATT